MRFDTDVQILLYLGVPDGQEDIKMDVKPGIPQDTLRNWQRVVDLMASLASTPAGLIMRVESTAEIRVVVASNTEGNAWKPGEQCRLVGSGLYCEEVIRRGDSLLVPDALKDPDWDSNPDIELGMTFYLGFPLLWPDGEPFGTICVLDLTPDNRAIECKKLIAQFKKVVENDLKLLVEIADRKRAGRELTNIKKKLEAQVISRTQRLEEVNTALKVLLREYELTKKEIEASILVNLNELIIPNLHRARKCKDNVKKKHYLDLVESGLQDITSSFSSELIHAFSNLTPAEVQVANLIRQGKKTKEIANFLNTATSTIDYHRSNIRKKMGISNRSTNLNIHLTSKLN